MSKFVCHLAFLLAFMLGACVDMELPLGPDGGGDVWCGAGDGEVVGCAEEKPGEALAGKEAPAEKEALADLEQMFFAAPASIGHDPFTLIIAADPQYPWVCSGDNYSCDPNTDEETQGWDSNYWYVQSMNSFANAYPPGKVQGVVINGDLTAFGHPYQIDQYWEFYENQLQLPVWPGLGNHDYSNNVNDCWENRCAHLSISYMVDKIHGMGVASYDWMDGPADIFGWRTRSGSLAYSWDIGDFHFVQLHYHPGYTRTFTAWNWSRLGQDAYDIRASYDWLRQDVLRATQENKRIIINMHTLQDSAAFSSAIRDANVEAVFMGHLHHLIGQVGHVDGHYALRGGDYDVPVYYSGSASYGRYLAVDFVPGERIRVRMVDARGGGISESNEQFGIEPVPGTVYAGAWSGSGGRDPYHRGNRRIELQLHADETVAIDLTSTADTYLYLLDPAGRIVTYDDDSGDGLSSRIVQFLPAGTYVLVAATYGTGYDAPFTVHASTGELRGGDVTSGGWAASGGRDAYHGGNPRFELRLDAFRAVTIDLTSSSVDTFLYLLDDYGNVLASDDDGGGSLDSRISLPLPAGRYVMVAASYSAGASGGFTLRTDGGVIAPRTVNGGWSSSGGRSPTASGNVRYTLHLEESATATIELTSSIDTYLFLLDGSGNVIASDDDSGPDYNARIDQWLAAGAYTVVAATYTTGMQGGFELRSTAGGLLLQ